MAGIVKGMDGIILFDDAQGTFGPMTDLRPSFDLRTGILTSAQRLARRSGLPIAARLGRPEHEALVAESHPSTTLESLPAEGTWLLINGRMADMDAETIDASAHEVDAEDRVDRVDLVQRVELLIHTCRHAQR